MREMTMKEMEKVRSRKGVAAILAGVLVGVALVGSKLWGPLWLALVPAVALVVMAVRNFQTSLPDSRLTNVGALAIQVGAAALLLLALVGAVTESVVGVEPDWVTTAVFVAGYVFTAGAALFGIAAAVSGELPRWPALLLGLSFPLGLGLDAATGVLPLGEFLFFANWGVYVGLAMFAVGLIGLGLAARRAEPAARG